MAKRLARIVKDDADASVVFDYDNVSAEHREPLRADAKIIRSNLIKAAYYLMDTGERLTRWREVLPHGAWLPWVVAEARMSPQSARDAINVFLRFRDTPLLLEDLDLALPQTAIVRLATAPDNAFEDVRDRLIEGDKLLVADVDEIVKRHRRLAKGEEESGGTVADPEPAVSSGADVLRAMVDRARDELVPVVIGRLVQVLYILEDYETLKPSKKTLEGKLRAHAQWLTDALEQLTQRRAVSDTDLVHKTLLDRQQHEPGPWAEAAAFLRDVSHSIAWEKIAASDVPELVRRGREVLETVLSPEERRSFFRMI